MHFQPYDLHGCFWPEDIIEDNDVVEDQSVFEFAGLLVARDELLDMLDTSDIIQKFIEAGTVRIVVGFGTIEQKIFIG